MTRLLRTGTAALLLAAACTPQDPPRQPAPRGGGAAPARTAGAPNGGGGGAPAQQQGGGQQQGGREGADPAPRPYASVITSAAVTREGMFKTHRVGSRLYFEIPRAELNREMLLVNKVAQTTLGSGYGGQQTGNRVVRWDRRDNRVLLRGVSYEITADSAQPIYRAVQAANYDPVIASFNVEAWGPDSAAVVDVTRLYTTSVPELGPGNLVRGALDAQRSFVERAASFPRNVEVEATHTYTVTPPSPPSTPEQNRPLPRSASVLMHWSMVRLPDNPMTPRLHDPRVGYFAVDRKDFGLPEQRVAEREYIIRWRLEKKDPAAPVSEPVKPIVYYVDPATPAQWIPWIKRGVEAWQPAFEAAGFRNAIVARDAPTPAEDPDWSPEDARYSVIRWWPSEVENARGPSVVDPRTGEILEADIEMHHNVIKLSRDWYFVQVGPLDARARRLPLPDSIIGRMLEYVVAHEVGHTLGFPHNMKASSTYPADSVRSPSFLARMGHTPTLMDYARLNYVAQPEDNVPVELLVPRIGPYDVFATKWGYTPIPGADTPEEERPTLDAWAREQDAKPWLRFSTPGSGGADPGELTEAVGDADAVRSTALGVRNLRRVMQMLIPAAERPGRDYEDLESLYESALGQWMREMGHVAAIVGGVDSRERYGGGIRFVPIGRARQEEAMRFLAANAFATPDFLVDPEVARRLEVVGTLDRVSGAQRSVLNTLLNDARLRRMAEFEALAEPRGDVYPLAEMLADLREGVWTEVPEGRRIDPFRRALQRSYLDLVDQKVNPSRRPATPTTGGGQQQGQQQALGTPGEAQGMLRGELRALDAQLRAAIPRAADRATRLHLEASRDRIAEILDPDGE